MAVIIMEYMVDEGQKCDNPDGIAYRFIVCPFCSKSQAFRFTSTRYCSDCNKLLIDALKLRHNASFRTAFHTGQINLNGVWVGDVQV